MEPQIKPPATISVDVDPLDIHLSGYGIARAPDNIIYDIAIPRLLDRMASAGVRATFFFVARDFRDAAAIRSARAVEAAGHEVASHSLNHGIPFRKLPRDAFAHEIRESKRRIEDATGRAVVGFRAPNWDLSEREFELLASEQYQYDASAYPSLLLCAARLLVAAGGGGISTFSKLRFLPFTWKRAPYASANGFVEFPITTYGILRFPVYHTLCYKLNGGEFQNKFDRIAASRRPLFYTMHAIDALAIGDGADARLSRHPGMERTSEQKLASIDACLLAAARAFACAPYRELLHLAKS
ncbi:MAG: polysaccharide deacetylase family protein [Planctomycetes bacterium]|nr:polysaccharide deacetylase family protein [Planctomycetota bacterium]